MILKNIRHDAPFQSIFLAGRIRPSICLKLDVPILKKCERIIWDGIYVKLKRPFRLSLRLERSL